LKLHLLYDCTEQLPLQASMSAPNINDIDVGRELSLQPGALYVFDKGYCDYNWWARIDAQGARFVTRFKRNAALRTERIRKVPGQEAALILSDEIVRFANPCPGARRRNHYRQALRRIVVARPGHEQPLVLATNDLESPAARIAQYYKQRWHIELFFKWIKQHLKIKRFLGRSENAVRIQILCALITFLLLALYRQAHGLKQSLWQLLGELRSTLFQRPATEEAMARRRRQLQAELLRLQPQLPL
jgi:putative transposase